MVRVIKRLMTQAGLIADVDSLTARGYAKWRDRAQEVIDEVTS